MSKSVIVKKHPNNLKPLLGARRGVRILSARSRQGQRGMTLIVGLVLLVMLMVISVIGFRNTTLSERMTGNVVDRNVSFQSAESAGKEALQVIESGAFSAATLGHYDPPIAGGGNANFWTQGAGATVAAANCATTTPFSWTSCAASVATSYASNFESAKYAIELIKTDTYGGAPGVPTTTVRTYRVSSRSTGGSGNADVVLQVLYTHTTVTP